MSPQAGELLVHEVAPRIRSVLPSLVPIGSEDREDLAQDAIAIAATLLVSTEARGKKVTPGNIAYYAVGLVRQVRRSTGQSKTDPMHPSTQLHGRSHMISLEAPFANEAEGGDVMCLHEVLACRTEDPSMAATRGLDWEPLVASLDATTREVLSCLVDGRSHAEALSRSGRTHVRIMI